MTNHKKVFFVIDAANDQAYIFDNKRDAATRYYTLILDDNSCWYEDEDGDFDSSCLTAPISPKEAKEQLNEAMRIKQGQILEIQKLLKSYE